MEAQQIIDKQLEGLQLRLIASLIEWQFNCMDINELNPFGEFFNKMNSNLSGWLRNEKDLQELLEDYKKTLAFLQDSFDCKKLLVQVGSGCFAKAKRIDQKIIVRFKEDLYVQLSKEEALPVVKSLIGLYNQKLKACKGEISKIMASMRQMENLIASYQNLA